MGELAGAVGAEVAVDDGVAIAEPAVDALDDGGLHELVVLAPLVRLLDGGICRSGPQPVAMDDRVVAARIRSQRWSRSMP